MTEPQVSRFTNIEVALLFKVRFGLRYHGDVQSSVGKGEVPKGLSAPSGMRGAGPADPANAC